MTQVLFDNVKNGKLNQNPLDTQCRRVGRRIHRPGSLVPDSDFSGE